MTQQHRLGETVEEYLRFRAATCSAATVKNEGFVLRRFTSWYGDVQLRHMKSEKVADWFYGDGGLRHQHVTRDGVHRPPIKATTANYYRTRLGSFFRWATRRGYLKRDLLQDVESLTPVRRDRLRLAPDDLVRLLDVAHDPRDRGFLAMLINTGFRGGTAISLKVGDVDLATETLRVHVSKSGIDDRFPVTADLRAELERWMHTYARDIGRPLRTSDYLFPARVRTVYCWVTNADGSKSRLRTATAWSPTRPMTHGERVVQSALAALGFPTRDEGCHTLRRSVARVLFDSMSADTGYDAALRTVSATLHHKSSATTEIYLGLTSERARRDSLLRGRPFLSGLAAPGADVVDMHAKRS
ncbi:MAG: tyrosine-type recombinase/integrase [Georgenia sp.]